MVDSKEEDEEEVWVKVKVRSFAITTHIQEIWQGAIRTLVPLAATEPQLNMLLKIVSCCYPNFGRDEEETHKYN
jgi:hypothetical protein